jgi:hypothetical protein
VLDNSTGFENACWQVGCQDDNLLIVPLRISIDQLEVEFDVADFCVPDSRLNSVCTFSRGQRLGATHANLFNTALMLNERSQVIYSDALTQCFTQCDAVGAYTAAINTKDTLDDTGHVVCGRAKLILTIFDETLQLLATSITNFFVLILFECFVE